MSDQSTTRRRVLGIAGSLAVAAVIGFSGTTLAAGPIASSSGNGALPNPDGSKRQFAFTRQLYKATNGAAKGEANLINPAFQGANGKSPYRLHIDIKCMKV